MKKLITLLALSCTVLAGCNVMAGTGEDIQIGGQKLENVANSAEREM